MHRGYIKLYRAIQDSTLWQKKPFDSGRAWIDMLFLANYKPSGFFKRGVYLEVDRGEIGVSMKGLSDRWGWSIGKVKRFLEWLENENQIETQFDNVTTRIKITNYEKYQSAETETERKRNANGTQTERKRKHLKNDKKVNNVKKKDFKEYSRAEAPDGVPFDEIISHLNQKTGASFKHTSEATRRVIRARWDEGHRLDDFLTVIDNQSARWLHDEKMRPYLRPDTLFRASKFEGYLRPVGASERGDISSAGAAAINVIAELEESNYGV